MNGEGSNGGQKRKKESDDFSDDWDDELAMRIAAEVGKLTPQLRKILTHSEYSDGRKRSKVAAENERSLEEATSLGDDPLNLETANGYEFSEEALASTTAKDSIATAQQPPSSPPEHLKKQKYMANEAYKPNAFGDFRTYMRNKRMKLKVQELSMGEDELIAKEAEEGNSTTYPPYFKGTNIYINGHTDPPYAELRRLIHLHGGELMPYLDTKSPVTHIIASNLTAKKRIEFKDYRVVRPQWITASIDAQKRLDWRDFRCTEDATGAMNFGALAGQSSVGSSSSTSISEQRRQIEEARRKAAQSDWRNSTGDNSFSTSISVNEDNIGPWGKASRQKTLGDWAKQKESKVEPIKLEVKSNQKQNELPLSVQLTAEDEQWENEEQVKPISTTLPPVSMPPPPKESPFEQVKTPEKTFANLGTDPPTEAGAIAAGLRDKHHPYASRPSNIKAAELMASPSWRERNTATSEGFLQGYFGKSRLHHLATWKSEMKEMVSQALRDAKREQGSIDLPKGIERVIMHIDFDAFFVSVGLRNRPELKEKAVVVCHADSETSGGTSSTSEIASCNYIARKHGIRNGMSLGQARRFCSTISTIPYDFIAYNDIAIKFYTFLLRYADAIEAVSIDEALIDVSILLEEMRNGNESEIENENENEDFSRNSLMRTYRGHENSQGIEWTKEKQLAESIRDEIRKLTECEVSIGIGSNVLLARLATRKAKPGGSFHLENKNINEFINQLEIDDLHGIGWSIRNRCRDLFGSSKVGELKLKTNKQKMILEFGEKHGLTIWEKLFGIDREKLESIKPRQSCGASINYAIRFKSQEEVKEFVKKLSIEVSNRLKSIQMVGKNCCISLMVRCKDAPEEAPKFLGHGICDTFNRSNSFLRSTDDSEMIFTFAYKLINSLNVEPDQMRGIGISIQKLESKNDLMNSVAKREIGQSVLSFSKKVEERIEKRVEERLEEQVKEVKKEKEKEQAREQVKEKEKEKEEGQAEEQVQEQVKEQEKKMEKVAEGVKESIVAPETPKKNKEFLSNEILPTSTQFVIPPASQLDQDVLNALPESIRLKILNNNDNNASTSSRQIESLSQENSNSPFTTPKKRKIINSFELMKSNSISPNKKRLISTKNTTSSAPSTPSGSQKGRSIESTKNWEPTISQIDYKVLNELPLDVRQEILRQISNGKAIESSKSDLINKRGKSESPRKQRQMFLNNSKVKGISNEVRIDERNVVQLPILKLDKSNAISTAIDLLNSNSTTTKESLLTPANITKDQLLELKIDFDFFKALPLQMQIEILNDKLNQKARFKSGKKALKELNKSEQRLENRIQALIKDSKEEKDLRVLQKDLPLINGLTKIEEINQLLKEWLQKFSSNGPKKFDLEKIIKFLKDCLRNQFNGLEKVSIILKNFQKEILNLTCSNEKTIWQKIFLKIEKEINIIVKEKFGGNLLL